MMMKHTAGLLGKFFGFIKRLTHTPDPPSKNVEQIYSKGAAVYTPEKQQKLQQLCENLFTRKELITTGRLQLIGLTKVKNSLGKRWKGLQKIVYTEVEGAISKYMMPKDIFIRYKDDSYVVVFADAGKEEAEIKARLIAEEIKRRLFDHEEEEVRKIDVEESVAVINADQLKTSKKLPETANIISQNIDKHDAKPVNPEPAKPAFTVPQAVEVETHNKKPAQNTKTSNKSGLRYSYLPLWDVKKNLLTSYLCLAHKGTEESDSLDAHEFLFMGASPSEKARIDLEILENVTDELNALSGDNRKLFIICPVHYDTLNRTESYEKYILQCQKIPEEQKRFLRFMLLNLPAQTHVANIPKFSIPLKHHCNGLFAQVPLDLNVDFATLRECRFDAVGVRLKKIRHGEKSLLDRLNSFSDRAKKALISRTFVLDVTSLSVTTSAVCADYDFLGGSVIHDSVQKPDNVYRFRHESLFEDLINNPTD